MQTAPLAALGDSNLRTECKPRDTSGLSTAPLPAVDVVSDATMERASSTEPTATATADSLPRAKEAGGRLHPGDDIFLRTHDARFSAQLKRLPLLARMPAPILVSGEPGTGRRCLARHVARLVAHPDPPSFAEADMAVKQRTVLEIDAHTLAIAEVDRHLGDCRRAAMPMTHATYANASGNGDPRVRRDADCAPCLLVLDVHLLSPRAQATLLALCDAGARAASNALAPGATADAKARLDLWRIVATADDRLEEQARAGTFDSRLLAHLCAITVRLPRLRERSSDIVPLAMLLLQQECERTGRALPVLTPGAVNRLLAHSWRGNVPELHAVMQAALAHCRKDSITGDDVRLAAAPPQLDPAAASLREGKRQLVLRFERAVLENLLQASQGNIAKAARLAQKNRRAFFELMRKHGIDAARFREAGVPWPDGAIGTGSETARA